MAFRLRIPPFSLDLAVVAAVCWVLSFFFSAANRFFLERAGMVGKIGSLFANTFVCNF